MFKVTSKKWNGKLWVWTIVNTDDQSLQELVGRKLADVEGLFKRLTTASV